MRSQNKTLSGDFDGVLAMQNVDWMKRKILSMVSINLDIKQSLHDGISHVEIGQRAGSIKGDLDRRVLDQTEQHKKDELFGEVKSRSRWIRLTEVQDDFLSQGWPQDDNKSADAETFVQTIVHGKDWVATEILGLGEMEGKRKLIRRIVIRKGDDQKSIVLIYDFISAIAV